MTRIAIVGVGNCACSVAQAAAALGRGLISHRPFAADIAVPGVEREIEIVAAFDVNRSKVGERFHEAIFAPPNCTTRYFDPVESDVRVSPGSVLDGIDGPLGELIEIHPECAAVGQDSVVRRLRSSKAEMMLIYLPVGAQKAAEFYAEAALAAGVSVINNTPAVLANSGALQSRFRDAGLVLMGDDMKSLIGSTTFHRALLDVLSDRGVGVDTTYQLNVGGNTDFLNMRCAERGNAKRATKRRALEGRLGDNSSFGIGPSDYIPHLKDNKVGYIRIEGKGYLGMPYSLELRLQVEDSPNAAAVAVEAVRVVQALRRGALQDDLDLVSAALFKAPASVGNSAKRKT